MNYYRYGDGKGLSCEPFDDNRIPERSIKKDMNGPAILKAEFRAAVKKMKSDKAAGPDQIVVEQLKMLGRFWD